MSQEKRRKAYHDVVCFFQFKTKMQRSCETVILQGGLNCENSESNRSGFPQIRKGSGGIQFRSASEGDEAYTGPGGCGICSVSRGAGSSRCGKRAEKQSVWWITCPDWILQWSQQKAECPGISSEFRDQCSSDRSCTAYRTSAGYRRGSYIRYLKGGGISGTGRNRDRGLCNNSPLCTVSCE